MNNTLFYMISFQSNKPIITLNDFIYDLSCSVVCSKSYTNKEKIIARVKRYPDVCIIYNASKQTYSNDPRHSKYELNVIRVLMLWAKQNIPPIPEILYIFGLETILEETEGELLDIELNQNLYQDSYLEFNPNDKISTF
jgi:hypothetical protein